MHACVCGDVGRVSGQGTIIGSGSAALPHTINLSFEAIAALISALSASATNPCPNVWLFLPSRVHTHASGYAVCASSWLDLGPPSLCGPRVCMGVRACLQACTQNRRACAQTCAYTCACMRVHAVVYQREARCGPAAYGTLSEPGTSPWLVACVRMVGYTYMCHICVCAGAKMRVHMCCHIHVAQSRMRDCKHV